MDFDTESTVLHQGLEMNRCVDLSLKNCGIFSIVISVLVIGGCSVDDAKTDEIRNKKSNLKIKNARLGEGVDFASDPAGATGETCIGMDRSVSEISKWRSRAFYTHTTEDVERNIDATMQGDVDTSVGAEFDIRGSWNYDESEERRVFSIVAHTRTVERWAGKAEEGDETHLVNQCKEPNPDWDLEEFRANCGTAYVRREILGGYVVLTTEISSLSKEEKRKLDANFNLEAGDKASGNLSAKMQWLESSSLNWMRFSIDSYGIDPPDSSLLDSDGNISASNVLNYINETTNSYQTALNDGEIYHNSYGSVIDQKFQRYSHSDYKACGVEEIWQYLQCYNDFQTDRRKVQKDRDALIRWLKEAQWKLDHPARVAWPKDEQKAKDEYQTAVNNVQECLNQKIPDKKEQCDRAWSAHKYETLCEGGCDFPSGCTPKEIEAEISGVPQADIRAPGQSSYFEPDRVHIGHNASYSHGSIDPEHPSYGEDICLLSEIGGGFYGSGEEVLLRPDTSTGQWKLSASSERSKETQHIFAGMMCLPSDAFFNEEVDHSDRRWHRAEYDLSVNGTIESTPMSDGRFPSALAGITGNMNGGGEWSKINQKSSGTDSLLEAKSNIGFLKTWGLSWGLMRPGNGVPDFFGSTSVDSNGQTRQRLGPIDKGVCYLTKIQGELDGTGEWARVEMRDDYWYLRVQAVCDKNKGFLGLGKNCKERKDVRASARCYSFNQNP